MKSLLQLLCISLLCISCDKERQLDPPKATAVALDGNLDLHLMSFNVRYESKQDRSSRAWSQRIIDCVKLVRDENPDIIGVQEGLHGQIADLWASLPDYELIGVGRSDGKTRGEYTGILFRRDRFELQHQETFWLSDTPAVPGSMSWGNQIPRVTCWALMTDRATGRIFYVYNTHWDHRNQRSRELAALMIADHIDHRKYQDAPVILLGDFNATERNPAMQFLTGNRTYLAGQSRSWKPGLTDTFNIIHPNESARTTLHFWSGSRSGQLKVDHILVSKPSEVLNAAIRDKDPTMVSDHFPVTAKVTFPPPAP